MAVMLSALHPGRAFLYPHNRPWRRIGLWDVEDSKLSRQSAHRWRWHCQLYSRGWVDPVPDPLLLTKSGSAGNRTLTSGSVARNSDHQATEAVYFLLHNIYINSVRNSQETQYISVLQPGTLTTRTQSRSTFFYITYINSVRTSQEAQ
jgi:hypothetical protein